MTASGVITVLIVCCTILAGTGIIVYGAWAIMTNEKFIKYLHDYLRNKD